MFELICDTGATTLADPVMRDISMDEMEAVSGGALEDLVFAFKVGYAIGTYLYDHNFPGTHWV